MSVKKKQNWPRPFTRKEFRPRRHKIITYDLETTNIAAGTPIPLYITGYGDDFQVAEVIERNHLGERMQLLSLFRLLDVLQTQFLTSDNSGCRFVGWNANNFDVFLVALALLKDERYELRPYMTRSKSLRGMRVEDTVTGDEWEFLDGMAMTGCMMKLSKFLEVFAPDYKKLDLDFENEEFDYTKQVHCEYAMRDSVGLWHALQRAEEIVYNTFKQRLRPTIGNMGIKIFQAHLPKDVRVQPLSDEVDKIVRDYVMRGGYCYCSRRYTGPVWKYDINQAYAAAMREAWLPDGYANRVTQYWARYPGIYKVNATKRDNKIPFYYRDADGTAVFGMVEIGETWLTSIEVEQLMREGWMVNVMEGYLFAGRFKMDEYVNKLEHVRMNADGGPNGAVGLMMKAIGNNSYGKTVEQLDGVEYILSVECPEGFLSVNTPDESDVIANLPIWSKQNEPVKKEYHKPQIGAFITAHVRMVVRRAALVCPDGWLYADTDCVVFDRDVTDSLDIHKSRYGAWKQESAGEKYRIVTKKVYAKMYGDDEIKCEGCNFWRRGECKKQLVFETGCREFSGKEQHAKGLHVKELSIREFENWSYGAVPQQKQVQRNNLMKVIAGAEMYIERVRKGTAIEIDEK